MHVYLCKCTLGGVTIEFKILASDLTDAIRKADNLAFESFTGNDPDTFKTWDDRKLSIKEGEF